ncbi:MAG: hypothetical protein RML12_02050 [Xanthomonadales bacterium]|nr:hypothetical protein [Xanthomonadales bacterium]
MRGRGGWPLLGCELLPLTDFCEWERIFRGAQRARRALAARRRGRCCRR